MERQLNGVVAEDALKAQARDEQPLDIDGRETGRFVMKPGRNIRARVVSYTVIVSILLYRLYLTTACRRPVVSWQIG